jgi:hypothetical protein
MYAFQPGHHRVCHFHIRPKTERGFLSYLALKLHASHRFISTPPRKLLYCTIHASPLVLKGPTPPSAASRPRPMFSIADHRAAVSSFLYFERDPHGPSSVYPIEQPIPQPDRMPACPSFHAYLFMNFFPIFHAGPISCPRVRYLRSGIRSKKGLIFFRSGTPSERQLSSQ